MGNVVYDAWRAPQVAVNDFVDAAGRGDVAALEAGLAAGVEVGFGLFAS
jgi:hypothetical protein